jgi:replication factor C small subunit
MTIPFIEKYRPKKLEDLVASEQLLNKFNEFIEAKSIPHLLLTGTAGLGKTTTAKILAKSISEDVLYINASDETSVETIRTKVKGFCATMSFGGQKIVILDEFDAMSMNAMMMLRNVMEEFFSHSRFILTCNYLNKVIEPIRSRCQIFEFKGADKVSILKRCAFILKEENIKFNKETIKKDLTNLVEMCYPDIRKIVGSIEKFTINGKFEFNAKLLEEDGSELIYLLKEKKLNEIRQSIVGSVDYEQLYRNLFDNATDISEQHSVDIRLAVA